MKKALLYLAFFGFLFAIPQGCIRDDRSDCPEDGPCLVLNFEYFDFTKYFETQDSADIKDIFSNRIDGIDIMLFDQFGRRELNLEIRGNEMAEIKRTRKKRIEGIDPGDYYVVCWGNNFSGGSSAGGTGIGSDITSTILDLRKDETIDPLHYAPDIRTYLPAVTRSGGAPRSSTEDFEDYIVTVAPKGDTEHTMAFMSAHRTLEVALVNWPNVNEDKANNPTIEIHNLVSDYDLLLTRGEEDVTMAKTSEKIIDDGDRTLGFASYYIPHFDDVSPIYILIKGIDTSGSPYERRVTMDYILEEVYTDWDFMYDGDDRTIRIDLEWDGLYVKVTMSKWQIKETDPEYNT